MGCCVRYDEIQRSNVQSNSGESGRSEGYRSTHVVCIERLRAGLL